MDHAHRLATADLTAALPKLRRYARVLMGGRDGADRLVVETLAGARQGQRGRPADLDLLPWLFGLMHVTHRRDLRRPPEPSPKLAATASGDDASDDMCARLLHLPIEEREVLLLVAVERLSYSDIASLLDVPVVTVLSTLTRARQRLCALRA